MGCEKQKQTRKKLTDQKQWCQQPKYLLCNQMGFESSGSISADQLVLVIGSVLPRSVFIWAFFSIFFFTIRDVGRQPKWRSPGVLFVFRILKILIPWIEMVNFIYIEICCVQILNFEKSYIKKWILIVPLNTSPEKAVLENTSLSDDPHQELSNYHYCFTKEQLYLANKCSLTYISL